MLIIMAIRKYVRFRHSIVSNEDLLEEISVLQKRVMKMSKEKDEIMAMKVAQMGGGGMAPSINMMDTDFESEDAENIQQAAGEEGVFITQTRRFSKLFEVDMFYKEYTPPAYNDEISLEGCEPVTGTRTVLSGRSVDADNIIEATLTKKIDKNVANVISLIDNLDQVTLDSEDAINAAQAAYNALFDDLKPCPIPLAGANNPVPRVARPLPMPVL